MPVWSKRLSQNWAVQARSQGSYIAAFLLQCAETISARVLSQLQNPPLQAIMGRGYERRQTGDQIRHGQPGCLSSQDTLNKAGAVQKSSVHVQENIPGNGAFNFQVLVWFSQSKNLTTCRSLQARTSPCQCSKGTALKSKQGSFRRKLLGWQKGELERKCPTSLNPSVGETEAQSNCNDADSERGGWVSVPCSFQILTGNTCKSSFGQVQEHTLKGLFCFLI